MTRSRVVIAWLALVVGVLACTASTPTTAARDAYKAAKVACQVYDLAPGERHTVEMDRACQSLRLVCSDIPAGGSSDQ